ncbi:iron-sulfur cluster co-chaperone protein HscB [Pholidichthys leucotaenia]
MLSVNSLRMLCSSRAVVLSLSCSVFKAVTRSATCCLSTSCDRKNTWDRDLNSRTLTKKRGQFLYTYRAALSRSCSTSRAALNCWNCKQLLGETPSFFCMSCKAVQPPEEGTSYFKIMDCDCTFTLDIQQLQRRFLQLQRSLHPDNFSQKSVKEQEYSESHSALVNTAYKTLLKPLSRGLYMLELAGMRIEEGTDPAADSNFLMELMEINEALAAAQTPEEANKIGQDTKGKLADLTEQINSALHKGELQAAKELLTQMKYYANIEEKVKEKLSELM